MFEPKYYYHILFQIAWLRKHHTGTILPLSRMWLSAKSEAATNHRFLLERMMELDQRRVKVIENAKAPAFPIAPILATLFHASLSASAPTPLVS